VGSKKTRGGIMNIDCPVIIPYYGGKYYLSQKLVPMIPAHDKYIEMFAGGLSMFFRKKKVGWNVVNDLDKNVVNLYTVLAEKFDEFVHHIGWYVKSRSLHEILKEYIKSTKVEVIPDAKRAARYYYLIRCSFNNNPQGTFSKNSADWNTDNLIEDLKYSRKYLNDVLIENLDFRALVDRYPPDKGDFWYLDPPYIVAGTRNDYYIHSLGEQDHIDLRNICKVIDDSGGNFMVSYDDKPEIHELYKDYAIEAIPVKYAGQTQKREYKNELVITNYDKVAYQETLFDGG
jgi:DNA adenine methylase